MSKKPRWGQIIAGILIFSVLLIGGVVVLFASKNNQDLRGRAAGPYSCTGTTVGAACDGFRNTCCAPFQCVSGGCQLPVTPIPASGTNTCTSYAFPAQLPDTHSCYADGVQKFECNTGMIANTCTVNCMPAVGISNCRSTAGLFRCPVSNASECNSGGRLYYECIPGFSNQDGGCAPDRSARGTAATPSLDCGSVQGEVCVPPSVSCGNIIDKNCSSFAGYKCCSTGSASE